MKTKRIVRFGKTAKYETILKQFRRMRQALKQGRDVCFKDIIANIERCKKAKQKRG